MKKLWLTLFALTSVLPLSAYYEGDGYFGDNYYNDRPYYGDDICFQDDCCDGKELFVEFNTGYSRSKIKLELDGHESEGTVGLSRELNSEWKDLNAWRVGGKARWEGKCLYARVYGDWGRIFHGKNHEHFNQTLRGVPISASRIDVDFKGDKRAKGHFYDVSGGIGYPFRCYCDTVLIAPMVGYDYNHVHLNEHFKHGRGITRVALNPFTPFLVVSNASGGSQHTHFRWQGPWLGADIRYDDGCWGFLVGYDFHFTHVRSSHSGDFTLRQINVIPGAAPIVQNIHENISFKTHRAYANNVTATLNYRFDCCWGFLADWEVGITGLYNNVTAHKGKVTHSGTRVQTSGTGFPSTPITTVHAHVSKFTINTWGILFNAGYAF